MQKPTWFHQQLIVLRDIFQKNGYPENFIDRCFKLLLNRSHILRKKAYTCKEASGCNNNVPQHLSIGKFDALNKAKQIVIQKSDNGNSMVIVDRENYIEKMENVLSDQNEYQKTAVKNENFLNFITSQEKRIDKIRKKLVDSNSMSKETRRHPKPVGTRD